MELSEYNWVKEEDVERMVRALNSFRGYDWWYQTENPKPESHCLAPLVLQNMKLGYESGDLVPTMSQFNNLLITAMFYQCKSQNMVKKLDELCDRISDEYGADSVLGRDLVAKIKSIFE